MEVYRSLQELWSNEFATENDLWRLAQSKEREELFGGIRCRWQTTDTTRRSKRTSADGPNFRIAELPERSRTEVKSVQKADEIVAGIVAGVSKRARSKTRNSSPLSGTGRNSHRRTFSPCPNITQKQKAEREIASTTEVGIHSSNHWAHAMD